MGGLEVVENDAIELRTFVGSCVAVCLFENETKIAAMAHIMLPKKTNTGKQTKKDELGKYADEALDIMLKNMIEKGADQNKIQAKIAGGATIFSHESETGVFNIGPRNIEAVRQLLKDSEIPLVAEDTGKNFGRWVNFDLISGKITIISNLQKSKNVI